MFDTPQFCQTPYRNRISEASYGKKITVCAVERKCECIPDAKETEFSESVDQTSGAFVCSSNVSLSAVYRK